VAGDETETGQPTNLVDGLTNPKTLSLDRFLIRTRGDSSTQSAWRLSIDSVEGQGTIIFVEASPGETFYRGDGVFLGWPQGRLEAAYKALQPRPDEPPFEMHQLG
jgi:hypothetical protein